MPDPQTPLAKLGFLTIGLFDPDDPGAGHEATLRIIELGEQLGFDSAWLRHRHLQYGISSPVAVLAAASQRTSRIELGTAVTPLGWENPLRLAEDWATVDVLSVAGSTRASASARRCATTRSAGRSTPTPATPRTSPTDGSSACSGCCAASPPARSGGATASRTSPTASSRTHRASRRGSGTAPRRSARPGGPASRGSTCSPAASSRPRSPRTSSRSSCRRSAPSAPPTRSATGLGSRRGSS